MVGNNIKKIRIQRNLNLSTLAKLVGISVGYLSDLEKGNKKNPSFTTLNKIADVLEVPVDYLLKQSAKAIIENKLDELNMTFNDLSNSTNIPLHFFDNLDNIIPCEFDYDNMLIVSNALDLPSKDLKNALSRQEPNVYIGSTTSAIEDFNPKNNDKKIVDFSDKQNKTSSENKLLNSFNKLNDEGKEEAIKRVNELTELTKYKKEEKDINIIKLPKREKFIWEEPGKEHLMPIASHDREGVFTEEDYKHDEDLMKDDDFWK